MDGEIWTMNHKERFEGSHYSPKAGPKGDVGRVVEVRPWRPTITWVPWQHFAFRMDQVYIFSLFFLLFNLNSIRPTLNSIRSERTITRPPLITIKITDFIQLIESIFWHCMTVTVLYTNAVIFGFWDTIISIKLKVLTNVLTLSESTR